MIKRSSRNVRITLSHVYIRTWPCGSPSCVVIHLHVLSVMLSWRPHWGPQLPVDNHTSFKSGVFGSARARLRATLPNIGYQLLSRCANLHAVRYLLCAPMEKVISKELEGSTVSNVRRLMDRLSFYREVQVLMELYYTKKCATIAKPWSSKPWIVVLWSRFCSLAAWSTSMKA